MKVDTAQEYLKNNKALDNKKIYINILKGELYNDNARTRKT